MTTRADGGGVFAAGKQGAEWISWRHHRTRIYLLVLLAAIAAAGSVAVFALRPLQGELTSQADGAANALLERSAQLFEGQSRALLRRAEAVAAAMQAELTTIDPTGLAPKLEALLESEPQLAGLAVLDRQGQLLAGAGAEAALPDAAAPATGLYPVALPLDEAGLLFTAPLRDARGRPTYWLQAIFDAAPVHELLADGAAPPVAPFVVWNEHLYFGSPGARILLEACGGIGNLLDGCGRRMRLLERPLAGGDWRMVMALDNTETRARVADALRWLPTVLVLVGLGLVVATVRVTRPLNGLFARTAQLYELSAQDELTGLSNRRHLMEALDKELARAARHRLSLNVLLMDIDRFKLINDTHGHAVGDAAIKAVGEAVLRLCRSEDVTARLGGDEFVVVQTDVDLNGAMAFAERLRQSVGRLQVDAGGDWVRLSVSVGLAHVPAGLVQRVSRDRVMGMADRALYKAKAAGRNQVKARGLRPVRQAVSSSS